MDIQLLKLPHLWKVAVTTAVWHRCNIPSYFLPNFSFLDSPQLQLSSVPTCSYFLYFSFLSSHHLLFLNPNLLQSAFLFFPEQLHWDLSGKFYTIIKCFSYLSSALVPIYTTFCLFGSFVNAPLSLMLQCKDDSPVSLTN
jgi:hypothetical protein